mgnify:CR=1 FL=1
MDLSDIQLPSNRKFGYFFTSIFIVFAAYLFNKGEVNFSYFLFGVATLLLLTTFAKADLLLPLNRLWMKLGLLLGMIVSPIVLGIIFYGLFTPISLLMKVFGRDELKLKLKARQSYWKVRESVPSPSKSFKNQF